MRVLIVDDSSFIRGFVRQTLSGMDMHTAEAGDGREALRVLRGDTVFDLLLIDCNMPVMNGLECLRSLRQERLAGTMKVMMVTTEADFALIDQALSLGADEFLMKPFTPQSLRDKLRLLGFDAAA